VRRIALGLAVVACALVTSSAQAQVHWDAEVLAGAQKRFLSQRIGDDAGFGPAVALQGHVALFPLLRVGAYARGELSPQGRDAVARRMLGGGAQVKITPPWPRGNFRMWATFGVGYVGVYAPSYHVTYAPVIDPNISRPDMIDGSGGGFLEIPIAIGVSYKLRKPWILLFQLDTRFGAGFSGSLYGGGGGGRTVLSPPSFFGQVLEPAGNDLFSVGLSVGIGFDL
jgi:hypothetical protein